MILTFVDWMNNNQGVAEWLGAVLTFAAVSLALWQSFFGAKLERRAIEKNNYSQKIFENIVGIEKDIHDLKQLFITRNHPIALDEAIAYGSEVEVTVLSSTELKTDISTRLNLVDHYINVSKINKYIKQKQAKKATNQIEKIVGNEVDLFRAVNDAENILEFNRSQLDDMADNLTQQEQKIFDETVELFDLTDSNLKELQEYLANIFG